MLTVTARAKRNGVAPQAVRYYSSLRLLRRERNPDDGYHLYIPREITWLRFIQQVRQLGCTLDLTKKIMQDADQGRSSCPRVR